MLVKVKRFSARQKLLETEEGTMILPVNNKYCYFKASDGTYVEGIPTDATKKELSKQYKDITVEKELDPEIGRILLEEHFKVYSPTEEVNKCNWKITISNLYGMFSNEYKDKENLGKLYSKIISKENFVEFLSFSTKNFKDMTVEELLCHQKECEKQETVCYTYGRLKKELHFTDKMIDELLPEPILAKNPYYSSAPPMKLYRAKIVHKVMQTEDYSNRLKQYDVYKKGAEKAKATREAKEEVRRQLKLKQQEGWHETLTHLELQDYYVEARNMKRHFILHLGPTNSGKTFEALQDFRDTPNSIYLAPLRLLAQEVAEETNAMGIACTMQTGEERKIVKDAMHWSKTIEMADLDKEYEVAVIDEGQMLGDRQRGGTWSEVTMGICAKRIHICASPSAQKELVALIEKCNDTYEIKQHERLTQLDYQPYTTQYQKGDALIVFSRKAVYAKAESLKQKGYSVSILYGAMPYSVKESEARLFREGKTDILVSTDCIGMGMNLPIRRVIFLEEEKFDGIEIRPLKPAEVKQIAGRAGRYNVYTEGYFCGTKNLHEAFGRKDGRLRPRVKYPRNIWELDGKLSEILEYWQNHIKYDGYCTQDCTDIIEKAKVLEDKVGMTNNQKILKYATVPFDVNYYEMWQYWLDCVAYAIIGQTPDMPWIYEASINSLEFSYKLLDIYCHFVAEDDHLLEEGMMKKQWISKKIATMVEESVRKNHWY